MHLDEFFPITKQTIINEEKQNMKIIHANVNGATAKKYKIMQFLDLEKPDVMTV